MEIFILGARDSSTREGHEFASVNGHRRSVTGGLDILAKAGCLRAARVVVPDVCV